MSCCDIVCKRNGGTRFFIDAPPKPATTMAKQQKTVSVNITLNELAALAFLKKHNLVHCCIHPRKDYAAADLTDFEQFMIQVLRVQQQNAIIVSMRKNLAV